MLGSTDDLGVLALAVVIDLALGELPAKFHPTIWIGRSVSFAQRLAPRKGPGALVAGGVIALAVPGLWVAAAFFAVQGLQGAHQLAYIIVGAILLKSTFAIKMLHQAAAAVRRPLADGDVAQAHEMNMVDHQNHPEYINLRQVGVQVRLSQTGPAFKPVAPLLGQHNLDILKELGFSDEEISGMEESGCISKNPQVQA